MQKGCKKSARGTRTSTVFHLHGKWHETNLLCYCGRVSHSKTHWTRVRTDYNTGKESARALIRCPIFGCAGITCGTTPYSCKTAVQVGPTEATTTSVCSTFANCCSQPIREAIRKRCRTWT